MGVSGPIFQASIAVHAACAVSHESSGVIFPGHPGIG
jgi:hypothetical protein